MSIETFMDESGMSLQPSREIETLQVEGANKNIGGIDIMGTMERTVQVGNRAGNIVNGDPSSSWSPTKFDLFNQ